MDVNSKSLIPILKGGPKRKWQFFKWLSRWSLVSICQILKCMAGMAQQMSEKLCLEKQTHLTPPPKKQPKNITHDQGWIRNYFDFDITRRSKTALERTLRCDGLLNILYNLNNITWIFIHFICGQGQGILEFPDGDTEMRPTGKKSILWISSCNAH